MEKPRISIVTPSFNQGAFLEQCICSVLDQNYPNLEYILIDGGSTDNSFEIIKKYKQHLTFWVSEPDCGQSAAINKGCQQATGEIVAWLNSDDFYLPGSLARIAEIYQQQPGASFYFGDGYIADKSGTKKCAFFPAKPITYDQQLFIFGLNYVLQPAAFINKQFLLQTGKLGVSLRYGMDFDLWARLAKLAEPVFVPEFLAVAREYETTKTATGSFARIEELRRIAEKHSNIPITPGIVLYFLDTLRKSCREHSDIFSASYIQAIKTFEAATGDLLKSFGGRNDGFPSVTSCYGVYSDSWTHDCVGMFYDSQQWGAEIEIIFEAPECLPTSSVQIRIKNERGRFWQCKKYSLKKGQTLTIRQTLATKSNKIEFLLEPSFQPKALRMGEDIRTLGCLCRSFKLLTKEGEIDLLSTLATKDNG